MVSMQINGIKIALKTEDIKLRFVEKISIVIIILD